MKLDDQVALLKHKESVRESKLQLEGIVSQRNTLNSSVANAQSFVSQTPKKTE